MNVPVPSPAAAPAGRPRPERLLDHALPALRATVATLVLTGLLYPLLLTGIAQVLFHRRAEGSFVADEGGRTVGSEWIAQRFSNPAYFQPRPSAAGDAGWDPLASGGSNLGPTSRKLRDRAAAELDRLVRDDPRPGAPVPVELVTTSGSGLDPHLSPAAAAWQAARVAHARGVSRDRILAVVDEYTEGRDLGVLGEPRVNVLALNLALDRRLGAPGNAATTSARGDGAR